MKEIVVIPTYDEKDNVARMAAAVLAARPGANILFVDDNSPDGTGAIVEDIASRDSRVFLLRRTSKDGLGKAYVAGFSRAIEMGAGKIVQMDCDFSHNPADLPRLLDADADLAIGSRYVPGGATPGWPFRRRLVSRAGGIFIRAVTGMPFSDPTGGFKAWKTEALEKIRFRDARSSGYSFQLELNNRAWRAGLSVKEIPIVFTDRAAGYSKISASIAAESFSIALKLNRFSGKRSCPGSV